MSILDRIDALTRLCPCGGTPRDGDPYCSEDCRPTHHGEDTIAHYDGTAMRWRPDLVTATPDEGLYEEQDPPEPLSYEGPWTGRAYRRPTSRAWHLRLDDGYRWVGADLDYGREEHADDVWRRLEHELGRRDHTAQRLRVTPPLAAPRPSWCTLEEVHADGSIRRHRFNASAGGVRDAVCAWLRAHDLNPNDVPERGPLRVEDNTLTVPVVVRDPDGGVRLVGDDLAYEDRSVPLTAPIPAVLRPDPAPAVRHARIDLRWPGPEVFAAFTQAFEDVGVRVAGTLRDLAERPYVSQPFIVSPANYARLAGLFDHLGVDLAVSPPPVEPEPPALLAVIEARKRRGPHGPQPKRRAPRRLDPNRRR